MQIWPLAAGADKEDHCITFGTAEPAPIRRLTDGLLRAKSEPTPVQGGALALSEALFAEDAVIIEGRRAPHFEEDGRYHAAEIRQGAFRLELPLPGALDLENVDTSYDRGMLRLRFDKREGR